MVADSVADSVAVAEPLVVTLTLDPAAHERFDALRRAHFPPDRNHLAAHLTLFHTLPGAQLAAVRRDVAAAVADRPAFDVAVTGLRLLGSGVAFTLVAPDLDSLRATLAAGWAQWLTPQDRQPFAPHVTVQNKVPPDEARRLYDALRADFVPWRTRAVGVALWRYLGGPWQPVAELRLGPGSQTGPT